MFKRFIIYFYSLFLISSIKRARGIETSARDATSLNVTSPLASSPSPIITTNGIPLSSQYCNCASNFTFLL